MYHRLQFRATYRLDLQVPGKARLEQVLIRKGEIIEAEVQPCVEHTDDGPVEVANLHLAGDGTLLAVPMDYFQFM
jgi:hypothetical protein